MMAVARPSTKITAPAAPLTTAGRTWRCGRGVAPGQPGDRGCPSHRTLSGRAEIAAQRHVGVQNGDQPIQVAGTSGGEESVDDGVLGHQVGVRAGRGLLNALPCPAGQFAGGLRRPLDDRRDLVERDREHVVQDERQSFGRCQGVQNHEQRQSHRIGQHRLMLGIDVADPVDDGVRHPGDSSSRGRARRARKVFEQIRATTVVSHASRLSIWPASAPAQSQPGLLHGILGVVDRAQHAVGHRTQMRPGGLESRCQVRVRGHPRPGSGSAHTRPSLKPAAPMPNARLNRPRRLPSVMMWVSPTS